MVSQAALILRVITLWFLALSEFYRDSMDPYKKDFTWAEYKDDFFYKVASSKLNKVTSIKSGLKY